MAHTEHGELWQKATRREFLKGSAALAASIVASSAAEAPTKRPTEPKAEPGLFLPPLLSRPTETSIRVTALNHRQPAEAAIELRKEGAGRWQRQPSVLKLSSHEMLDWNLTGLSAATRYEYRILMKQGADGASQPVASGRFRTQRKRPASYTAVLITDPHTGSFREGSEPVLTLDRVVQNASKAKAEFVLDLGDNVAWPGSREYGQKSPDGAVEAYARYRRQLGPLSMNSPHFAVIGNWSGESGKFPERSIEMMAAVRRAFLPGPNHQTYPQGGSQREDYYAFSWGDALYVILNIQTYSAPSRPNELPSLRQDVNHITEWTLGEKQMTWFEMTLRKATERFRFVCMHHPAGGNAGDRENTLYGRGGARAWNTGEQARIHALMKKHHVQIFFYGHDHVFVDDVVDGIHYALPGSCGAPWKFTGEETGYERFWPDSGHAQLDVTPKQATVSFINVEGKVLHSFSVLPA
jgi:phosphodiesterase/alkaline phosphatase D-like protein